MKIENNFFLSKRGEKGIYYLRYERQYNQKTYRKTVSLSTSSKREAIMIAQKIASWHHSGKINFYRDGIPENFAVEEDHTFRILVEKFLNSQLHWEQTTYESYNHILYDFGDYENCINKNVHSINTSHIHSYLSRTRKDGKVLSRSTQNKDKRHLSAFWNWMIKKEIVDHNVVKEVKLGKEQEKTLNKAISISSYQKLIEGHREFVKNKTKKMKWFPVWLTIMFATGMRREESGRLRWSDIDLGQGSIIIRRSKGRTQRVIAVEDMLVMDILKNWKETTKYSRDEDFVFPNENGKQRDGDVFYRALKKIGEVAGIRNVTVHGIRHGFATDAINSGENIKIIQEVLGHSNIKVTEKYIHLTKGVGIKRFGK